MPWHDYVGVVSSTAAILNGYVETIQQQDSAERAFSKLTRTFAAQVEGLSQDDLRRERDD
jgi:hypothetical protein